MFRFLRSRPLGPSATEKVYLSLMLDDWCRNTGTSRSDAAFEGIVQMVLDLHAAGLSCEAIRLRCMKPR
jgi:hypothetical protein